MCDINDLAAVMWKESKLKPNAVNGKSNATGLIQFMPDTASQLGTTTTALLQMSNVAQLPYVKKYLAPYRGKLNSYSQIYRSVFYPVSADKPLNWTFPHSVYLQNSGLDINGDGKLSVADFEEWILKDFPTDLQKLLKKK